MDEQIIPTPIPTAQQKAWILNDAIEDVGKSTWNSLFAKNQKSTYGIIFGGLVWSILMLLLAPNPSDPGFFGFLAFIPVLIFFGYVFFIYEKTRHLFYEQFAFANNLTYYKSGSVFGLSGALFNIGHSKKTEDIMEGKFDGNNFTLFNYLYTTGSGKNQQRHYNTVAKIEYPTILPPILLTVDSQYFGGIVPLFSSWKKIKPEGNFDKNFDLYSKKEFEIEALQIFSPDFMERMLTDWKEFNLEFNDTTLFLFCNSRITSKAQLQKMYDFMEYLIARIEPVAIRMKSSLMAMEAMGN